MGRWLTAGPGDTFCHIAAEAGFVNCAPVRDHAANVAIGNRQLRAGDDVYVPDLVERQDSAPTERRHVFVRLGVPFASIRFVHGSAAGAFEDDVSLAHLEISNYRTDRAGTGGWDAFAGPNHWKFHAASDADPDAFKVEVRDTRTGNAQLTVTLEALHPIYDATGAVTGHDLNWSSAAEAARRRQDIRVFRATPAPDQRFRSPYLRLVTDQFDKAARPQQTLLVTDDQQNEERVEILDQQVRATYIIDSCPRAGDARCRVTAQLPIGNNRHRIKMCVGIFRQNIGDATGFNGRTEADIRYRVFRWFRRIFAQANMAPKIVAPGIRFLDPPQRNMLTVSNINGRRALGRTSTNATPSRMSFTITSDRGGGVVVNKDVELEIPAAATPATRPTPKEIADQLVTEIDDADFVAETFENPPALGTLATRRSTDIVIRDRANGRVSISTVRNTERSGGATLTLAAVNLNRVTDHDDRDMEYGTIEQRQIMRNFDSPHDPDHDDGRLDCYVVGRFVSANLHARAFSPCIDLFADFRPHPPSPFSIFLAARAMAGSDHLPTVLAHEAGHSLFDCFHSENVRRTELMFPFANGNEAVMRGPKRLSDRPVRIRYANYRVGQTAAQVGSTTTYLYSVASERLLLVSPQMYDPW